MTGAGSAARDALDRIRSSSARQTRLFALGVVVATQFAFAWRFARLSPGGALLYVGGLWAAVLLADQAIRSRRRRRLAVLEPGELASAPANLRSAELQRLLPDVAADPHEYTLFGTLSVRPEGLAWVPLVVGTPELAWRWDEIGRVDWARYTWVPAKDAFAVVLRSGADVVFLLDDARAVQRAARPFVVA
ncbi:MAG TPA: hypothetical protein VFW71_08365 [Actinomycetota bacterium]|nr:hypothetical protein [Actinomycetota bacterium]